MTIPAATRMRSFARSFFLQAGWNYDRMQHLGFAFAMMPVLSRLYPEQEARIAATRRHLEYFNTHPYLGSALIGASIRLEQDVAMGSRRPDEVVSFKNGIMGSYGAIGDAFFWAALRPLGAVIAVLLALLGLGIAGPIVFVAGYDAIAGAVRGYGFFRGISLGPMVVARLSKVGFAELTRWIKISSAVLAGFSAAVWAHRWPGLAPHTGTMVAFPVVVLCAGAARRGVSPALSAAVLAVIALLARTWMGRG